MESYILDWFNLLFRWLHIIFGAAWIGTSFYFNWLNHNLREPEDAIDGVNGQLFAVHGGHFYRVMKYAGAPEKLPKTLHWFKWEAYFTWISGVSLLAVVYYFNADLYLIDNSRFPLEPWQAISISIGSLVGGWLVYDLLCKSPLSKQPVLFSILGFSLITAAAYGLSQCFGDRASYIHVGAMLGTMMAANVFFVIIPNQRIMVDAMTAGKEPDTSLGDAGALRSLHNNYFTLPVLFIMVSNHFPMTYGHEYNWLVLAALSLIGAGARHYFNLKHKGENKVWILPVAALAMVALAMVSRPPTQTFPTESGVPEFASVQTIMTKRCQPCHSSTPTFDGVQMAPQGVVYDTPEQIKSFSPKIKSMAVDANTMPPGNLTHITDEERATLGAWIAAGSPLP
ncbi:MAG: urate hydroxylase PuuD [Myxococcota bacterium]|nr:urate hydroxylase PuuD [Myxococcota bacterium]